MLQDGETILHRKNDDPYNMLGDKLVTMNKQLGRIALHKGGNNASSHNKHF